jgi:hypothetical protein
LIAGGQSDAGACDIAAEKRRELSVEQSPFPLGRIGESDIPATVLRESRRVGSPFDWRSIVVTERTILMRAKHRSSVLLLVVAVTVTGCATAPPVAVVNVVKSPAMATKSEEGATVPGGPPTRKTATKAGWKHAAPVKKSVPAHEPNPAQHPML